MSSLGLPQYRKVSDKLQQVLDRAKRGLGRERGGGGVERAVRCEAEGAGFVQSGEKKAKGRSY